jgi:hypothetical protein
VGGRRKEWQAKRIASGKNRIVRPDAARGFPCGVFF